MFCVILADCIQPTRMKILILAALIGLTTRLSAQITNAPEQDCANAISICAGAYYQEQYYSGGGLLPNEINPNISCLGGNQEVNGTWYEFTIETAGQLNITICAYQNGQLYNNTYDYDWAIYNLTNATCADISTNPALEVGCNFSGFSNAGGCTGPNGQGGPQNGPPINVQPGQRYVLFVSRWTQTPQIGYVLNLCATTAGLVCSENQNAVEIQNPVPCGALSFVIEFDQPIRCNDIQAEDIAIVGPDGAAITITGITPIDCNPNNPNAVGTRFIIQVGTPITLGGGYVFSVGGFTDLCGNPIPPYTATADLELDFIADINLPAGQDAVLCEGESLQLNVFTGNNPPQGIQFDWQPVSGLSAYDIPNPVATPYETTTYTVTARFDECVATDEITITVVPPLQVAIEGDFTICRGESTTLVAVGTALNYFWPNVNVVGPQITVAPLVTTTYTLLASSVDCANLPFTATVTVIPTPIPDFTIAGNICQDEVYEVVYTGESEATNLYEWNFADGQIQSGSGVGPIYVRFPFAGPRTVSVTANNLGCSATLNRNILVRPKPVIDAGEATFMCENAFGATLNPSISPDVPGCLFYWSPPDGLDNPNSRNPTAFISQTTTYSLTAVCNGCSSLVDSVTVYVRARPTVILEDYTVGYCLGQGGAQIQAIASGGTGPLSYQWYAVPDAQAPATGINNIYSPSPVASPTTPQYYKLVVTDSMGCRSDTATVFVDVYPVPAADAGGDTFLCYDAPGVFLNGSGFFPNGDGFGSFSFRWRPAVGLSDTTIANPFATPQQTTIYTLIVTSEYGCSSLPNTTDDLATVVVTRAPRPLANAGPDKYLCFNAEEGVQIGDVPSGGVLDEYEYYWTPAIGFNPLSDTAVMRPVVKPEFTTTYFLKAKFAGCESIADTVTVFVVPRPTSAVDVATLEVCPGKSVQIRGIGGGNVNGEPIDYLWRPGTGLSDSTAQNPIASPETTTVYTLYTYIYGCKTETPATALVQVLPQPVADADPLDLPGGRYICAGDTVQLSGFAQSPAQPLYVRWEPPTRLSNSEIVNPLAFPLETTTYTLIASYGPCVVKDSITVRVGPAIPVRIEADTNVICGGTGTYLRASGGIGSGDFIWRPTTGLSPATGAVVLASPSTTTMYTLTLREAGCIGIDSVLVEVVPGPVTRYFHSFPGGCNQLTVSFTDQSRNVTDWEWNFGDGSSVSNVPSPVHTYLRPGTYTVTLRTRSFGQCYDDDSVSSTVTVTQGLNAAFGVYPAPVDTFLWPAPEFTFVDSSTGGVISWFWDFGDGMSAFGPTVSHAYFLPGTYNVTQIVSDHLGCVDTASTKIVIKEKAFELPNIFTPNGDGSNDLWCIDLPSYAPVKLKIFDRHGVLLYESASPKACWDGRSNNGAKARAVPGQYFYVLTVGERLFHGGITLME